MRASFGAYEAEVFEQAHAAGSGHHRLQDSASQNRDGGDYRSCRVIAKDVRLTDAGEGDPGYQDYDRDRQRPEGGGATAVVRPHADRIRWSAEKAFVMGDVRASAGCG